jgi:hypothetical protein
MYVEKAAENKKFWEELIRLLSLQKLTVNNLVAWLPWNINNPNPLLSKARLTKLNLNNFKTIEAVGLKLLYPGTLECH